MNLNKTILSLTYKFLLIFKFKKNKNKLLHSTQTNIYQQNMKLKTKLF